ncbi:hypothetical protein BDP27DRAFT_1332332 [Rhodocollybia butyracea]|uniref:Uncharacterized protein n=1 Tax=Rhodocollybia butyracea TaxID=206335 RepID=A0A9P5U3P0_9AGAR|nr:hypothetical protein BDP27DRAFT_1332332 [Rhodocollybia butyracea]
MPETIVASLEHSLEQLFPVTSQCLPSVCFPIHRRFTVIPQALLRRVIATNTRVNELNISTGSSGGRHWGRETKVFQAEENLSEPGGKDYILISLIVKVVPTQVTQPRKHYIVCVDQESAEAQMSDYMTTLINHPYRVPGLKGYLLRGRKYLPYQIVDDEVEYKPGEYKDIFAPGDPLTALLCTIAVEEWNRASVDVPVNPPVDPAVGEELEALLNAAGI